MSVPKLRVYQYNDKVPNRIVHIGEDVLYFKLEEDLVETNAINLIACDQDGTERVSGKIIRIDNTGKLIRFWAVNNTLGLKTNKNCGQIKLDKKKSI